MISLSPGSLCDVCADEYGPRSLPHSIPCGHVLCLHCCTNILEKTPPRQTPSCPFCRVPFTSDGVRLIRVDFPSAGAGAAHSGYSTPTSAARRALSPMPTPAVDADDDVLLYNPGRDREHPLSLSARSEAKLLEHRVAKVATKKCSVEEVVTLQRELQDWLRADGKHDDQAALKLSAALLRAIILNHTAHTQATEHAKSVEAALKEKLDEVQAAKDQLEAELRRLVRLCSSALPAASVSVRARPDRKSVV